jgi:hypothetical protein
MDSSLRWNDGLVWQGQDAAWSLLTACWCCNAEAYAQRVQIDRHSSESWNPRAEPLNVSG